MFIKLLLVFVVMPLVATKNCIQEVNCFLPQCFCPTRSHPMFKNISDIPQMVYFGFDDAVTGSAKSYYDQLFTKDRKNPNGCPIHMSLYISNDYTIYPDVKMLYKDGHEIAVHSVTHTKIDTKAKVLDEGRRQRENLVQKAGVKPSDVVGWRSPFLNTAGDDQVVALEELHYTYDISLTYLRKKQSDFGLWPLTLDYGWPNFIECQIPPCPKKSHPGFWEFPVNSMRDFKDAYSCGYVDGCYNRPSNYEEAYKYLMDNFLSYYRGNRAPFGLSMHYAWFMTPYNLDAMEQFIIDILKYDDVYILSAKEILEWMKNPKGLSGIRNFQPWSCGQNIPETERPKPTRKRTTPTTTTTTKPTTVKKTTTTPTTTTKKLTTKVPTTTRKTPPPTKKPKTEEIKKTTPKSKPPTTAQSHPTTKKTEQVVQSVPNRSPAPRDVGRERCIQDYNCHLPGCYCASTGVPGNISLSDAPQMVYITFEGNLDATTNGKIAAMLSGADDRYRNPNNCPYNMTFFLSQRTPFLTMKRLHRENMEIAMIGYDGVRRDTPKQLEEEITLQLKGLSNLMIDAKGWRSPDLKPLGDEQFEELLNYKLEYDATLTIPTGMRDPKPWPYTLDFGFREQCVIRECPKRAYPGLWEIHHEPVIDFDGKFPCSFIDGCRTTPKTAQDTFRFLWNNFIRHYRTNKSPFGVHLRSLWFSHSVYQPNLDGVKMFLEQLLRVKDVYVLPIQDIIQWMRNPVNVSTMLDSRC